MMTELLIRKFVKNHEDVTNTQVRTDYGILASVVGILLNVLLFAGKFILGAILHSLAVVADAFNNLSDAASSVIGFIGMKMANKPADKEHPFGHGRIEYIAAFIVSIFVIQVGLSFFSSSVERILSPETVIFAPLPFVLLLVSMVVKLWIAVFNRKIGKRIDSKVMLATSTDALGDIATTGVTVIALLASLFIPEGLLPVDIDAVAGIVVSVLIFISGIGIAKDTLAPLIGVGAPEELYREITKEVESYEGIYGTHDLIIHNYGPQRYMATIHAEVANDADVEFSHEIIDRAEREVSRKLGILLVIHMDPIERKDKFVLETRERIRQLLHALDENLSFHDFRMVNGEHQINLIFDVVVPSAYTPKDAEKIRHQVASLARQLDPRYECVITLDHDFGGIEG